MNVKEKYYFASDKQICEGLPGVDPDKINKLLKSLTPVTNDKNTYIVNMKINDCSGTSIHINDGEIVIDE